MTPPAKVLTTVILLVISSLLLYLTFVPLLKSRQNLAALIGSQPITRSQLNRALDEQLWLEGKSFSSLAPADLTSARDAALAELIDHELLRREVQASATQLAVSPTEIDDRLYRFTAHFETKDALQAAMKSQGIATENALRNRLTAQIRQEKLVEQRIAPAIAVTEEEAKKWFDLNQASISQPERIQVRHIFLPTLDHPSEEAKLKLTTAFATLTENQSDFATLAQEISEDPASKDHGGALGWMTRDRLPTDFAAPAFSMELHRPALIQTKLGWHLVEITAHQPAEPRNFEQAKLEVIAALQAVKRRHATAEFRRSLRQRDDVKIEIF
jgi:parvulin-like peptidyl-prolyl isomerase